MSTVIRPTVVPIGAARPVAPAHLRITRRGRTVLVVLIALLVAGGLALGLMLGAGAAVASDGSAPALSTVTVRQGDSLWTVAEAIAPRSDPRDVIASIQQLNGLPSATVVPGQRLAIPSEYSAS